MDALVKPSLDRFPNEILQKIFEKAPSSLLQISHVSKLTDTYTDLTEKLGCQKSVYLRTFAQIQYGKTSDSLPHKLFFVKSI